MCFLMQILTYLTIVNINHNNHVALYLETVYSNGFLQKISKATRICNSSYSLIDHILYKSNNNNSISGTILTNFSDHLQLLLVSVIQTINPKLNTECLEILKNLMTTLANCDGEMFYQVMM